MKKKHLLSTAAVLAGLLSGAALTTQTANAQSITQEITQKGAFDPTEISSVYFEHYNVLRAKLKTPVSAKDYYLVLAAKGVSKGEPVKQNGNYIGFDLNLDDLVKEYPTVADREKLFDSLFIRSVFLTANKPPVTEKLTNQDLKNELLNYNYLGSFDHDESVSNLIKGNAFNKFFNAKPVYGDHLLDNGYLTTQTLSMQFDFKPEMKNGYTYALIDASGKIAGKTWPFEEYFFVFPPEGKNFLPKEYTITAKSTKTGEVFKLATFTPVHIF
ncbi:hypothetical protein [Candidatus Enterococcus mansonii]|uniref:Uncharacterized protein n=1 Tax=Candidatus Enterococcus mansonii TaxID=1834181 RepID=A0A242CCK6_9ENTE|nr:hypothetical protein [Enterococcus sp. 4G2_DIV0659]OTO07983.1 hypothetical protein A5880_002253 [Enterococcus sp. 4G2_DIV0659]